MTNKSTILTLAPRDVVENEPWTESSIPLQHLPEVSDPTTQQIMRIVEVSGSLAFWDRPEEDVYTIEDGEPL